jgi:hypothetical protein
LVDRINKNIACEIYYRGEAKRIIDDHNEKHIVAVKPNEVLFDYLR